MLGSSGVYCIREREGRKEGREREKSNRSSPHSCVTFSPIHYAVITKTGATVPHRSLFRHRDNGNIGATVQSHSLYLCKGNRDNSPVYYIIIMEIGTTVPFNVSL